MKSMRKVISKMKEYIRNPYETHHPPHTTHRKGGKWIRPDLAGGCGARWGADARSERAPMEATVRQRPAGAVAHVLF